MQFGRQIQLTIGDKKFSYPDFFFDFRMELDDDPEPNDGEVTVYNLSQETISVIREGQPAVLSAGYGEDIGTIMAGFVRDAETKTMPPDRQTVIDIIDAGEAWLRVNIQKSYKSGTRASQVLTDIFSMAGLETGEISLPTDVVYTAGLVVSGALGPEAKKIVRDCGAKLHIQSGTAYIRPPEGGRQIAYVLRHDTGLIESPQRIEGEDRGADYNAFCLLNHRLKPDSIVKIESNTANGLFRIRKSIFLCNEQDFMNHLEVVGL